MYGIFYIRSVSVGLNSQIWYLFLYNRIFECPENIRNYGFPDVRWPSKNFLPCFTSFLFYLLGFTSFRFTAASYF